MVGWQQCQGKDKLFYLNIQDQNGLIGLNSASNPLLKIGFLSLGYNESEAAHLADRVETYREIGTAVPGGENDATLIAKHAPFENIAELYEVLTPPLPEIDRIADVFTIQNKTDSVTVSHAHRALRKQLEQHDTAQQFVASDDLPSEHAEVSFAEFKAGEPFGFLSRILLERSTGENSSPKILQKQTAFTSLDTLELQTMEPMRCPDLLKKLTEGTMMLKDGQKTSESDFIEFLRSRDVLSVRSAYRILAAIRSSPLPFDVVVTELGLLNEASLAEWLRTYFSVPQATFSVPFSPVAGLETYDLDFARTRAAIPIGLENDELLVAFANPLEKGLIETLSYYFQREIQIRIFLEKKFWR